MARTGRPTINGRKTSIGIRHSIDGWVQFMAASRGGIATYLNDLAEADRFEALSDAGETAERYRAFLVAMGMDDELASLDAGTFSPESGVAQS